MSITNPLLEIREAWSRGEFTIRQFTEEIQRHEVSTGKTQSAVWRVLRGVTEPTFDGAIEYGRVYESLKQRLAEEAKQQAEATA